MSSYYAVDKIIKIEEIGHRTSELYYILNEDRRDLFGRIIQSKGLYESTFDGEDKLQDMPKHLKMLSGKLRIKPSCVIHFVGGHKFEVFKDTVSEVKDYASGIRELKGGYIKVS